MLIIRYSHFLYYFLCSVVLYTHLYRPLERRKLGKYLLTFGVFPTLSAMFSRIRIPCYPPKYWYAHQNVFWLTTLKFIFYFTSAILASLLTTWYDSCQKIYFLTKEFKNVMYQFPICSSRIVWMLQVS